MDNPLIAVSTQMAEAVRQAGRLVVAVDARQRFPATGVLWKAGTVVTAGHALKREEGIAVTFENGSTATARLAGHDPGTDLAVLKVEAPAVEYSIADSPVPGTLVFAVGRAPDKGVHATMGVISMVGGPCRTWRGGRMDRYLRLDLRLYPGASGAAVIDAAGRLIGVATSALSRIAPLAIPASTVGRVTEELLEKGHVTRGYLGVGLQPVVVSDQQAGLIILSLEAEGPAAKAGLLIGDILISLEGAAVRSTEDVQNVLDGRTAGTRVAAAVLRGGARWETTIALGERAWKGESHAG